MSGTDFSAKRYLLECTQTSQSELNTGIQRVVRNVVNCSLQNKGQPVVPVQFVNGHFFALPGPLALPQGFAKGHNLVQRRRWTPTMLAYLRNLYAALRQLAVALLPLPGFVRFVMAPRTVWGLSRLLLLPLQAWRALRNSPAPLDASALAVGHGDVLVLLDSSWNLPIWYAVRTAKERGAKIICICYDLIPITHPQFFDAPLVALFEAWMKQAMEVADGFVCISRAVAHGLRSQLDSKAPDRVGQVRISHFGLGSQLDGHTATSHKQVALTPEIEHITSQQVPVYLFVSTIEPRKNHAYALDAFERLWADGSDAVFVIVGRIGWLCHDFVARVREHSQFKRRLFMLNQATDTDLAALYKRANGLIFTSITEGFGLPIVEALQHGVPVFASDIPVFREIGEGQGITFVDLENPESAARALAAHVSTGAPRLPKPVDWPGWSESTRQFWAALEDCLPDAFHTAQKKSAK